MTAVLHYGVDASLRLELAQGALVADCGNQRLPTLADPAAALEAALTDPLDWPALAQGTTPGDRIVLALESGVPQADQIVAATIDHLERSGVSLDGIALWRTQADLNGRQDTPCSGWPKTWQRRVHVLVHDPTSEGQFAYLATSRAGEAVVLNRALVDADVVLPIGTLRRGPSAGYFGVHGGVFPTFSDQRTLMRFRAPDAMRGAGKHRDKLQQEVDEVAWLLGLTFTIQALPGGGDRVLDVLAGAPAAVALRGRQLYGDAWGYTVPRRASLVVAAIEGGAAQQTWENLGRALAAAGPLVEEGGAIAVCCDLAAEPGPAVQGLFDSPSARTALHRIGRSRPEDLLPATQLVDALQQGTVYLMSRLDAGLVEQLNMVPLAGAEELERLVRRHPSCILLANAPQAAVTVDSE